jgi:hypothetical protein
VKSAAKKSIILIAAFIALNLLFVAPALSADSPMKPATRGYNQFYDQLRVQYKIFASSAWFLVEGAISALRNPPASDWAGSLVWGTLTAEDGLFLLAKKSVYRTFAALVDKEKKDHTNDHKRWDNNIYSDLTTSMNALYDNLSDSGALSFSSNSDMESNFDRLNPGYRDNIAYLDDYKTMMSGWQDYSVGFFDANRTQFDAISSRLSSIAKMKDASFGTGTYDSTSADMKNYRAALQVRNQTNLFAAQEVSNLRLDIARQIDSRVKFALTLQQTRTDRQAAFDRSVGAWSPAYTGSGY